VPFAQSPIGPLRWAAPEPIESWGNSGQVLQAMSMGAHCTPLVYSPTTLAYERPRPGEHGGSLGNSEECAHSRAARPAMTMACVAHVRIQDGQEPTMMRVRPSFAAVASI
jgi:hypothetical protein